MSGGNPWLSNDRAVFHEEVSQVGSDWLNNNRGIVTRGSRFRHIEPGSSHITPGSRGRHSARRKGACWAACWQKIEAEPST